MRMRSLFYLLVFVFLFSPVACDDDSEEGGGDNTEPVDASDFPYSCHFADLFNKDLLHCVGYKNATSLEQATEWCNDNALGCAVKMKGTAKEGGCESIAEVSSGHCKMNSEKCGFTWGTTGSRTPEQDCDKSVMYSSAWGCESQGDGKYICTAE